MGFIVAPNEGLNDQLRQVLRKDLSMPTPWKLGLYVNDLDPGQATVFADLTEPTWPSYTRKDLDPATWTSPTIIDDHAASDYGTAPLTFLNDSSSAQTVYGYFILDEVAGLLRFVQRFDDGDIREVVVGGVLTILPHLTLTTEEVV